MESELGTERKEERLELEFERRELKLKEKSEGTYQKRKGWCLDGGIGEVKRRNREAWEGVFGSDP